MATAAPTPHARHCGPRASPLVCSLHHEALAAYSHSNPRPLTRVHLYVAGRQPRSPLLHLHVDKATARVCRPTCMSGVRTHTSTGITGQGRQTGGRSRLATCCTQLKTFQNPGTYCQQQPMPQRESEPGCARTSMA
jgi:hypothetical protein